MNLLALDTSTERLCLALCLAHDDAEVDIHVHEEEGGPRASMRLLPAARELLARHGLDWSDLTGLAFGQGPGAFTGLRGSCSAVQGLALGLGLESVAIPSLRIVAEDARLQAVRRGVLSVSTACVVRVAVDARMGQVYEGCGAWDGQRWYGVYGSTVRDPADVAGDWLQPVRLADDSKHAVASAVTVMAGSGLNLMPVDVVQSLAPLAQAWIAHEVDRAYALGRCAVMVWRDPGVVRLDAAQVMPLYVRDQVALTTVEREQQARARAESVPSNGLALESGRPA
jgi:tRNA threonylcarbamoyladenosine biosynthesis protein TsaB